MDQRELFDRRIVAASQHQMGGDDQEFLRMRRQPAHKGIDQVVRVADLFSGVGGITVGIREACRTLGLGFQAVLAMDFDRTALTCFTDNFAPTEALLDPIEQVFRKPIHSPLDSEEMALAERIGKVDLLVGGPPCQGHSDFNNSTRRDDPKNALYLCMVRATEVLRPDSVLIENVVGALNDKNRVVQTARHLLEALGYRTSLGVIDFDRIGVPQTRRRIILLGSRSQTIPVESLVSRHATSTRDLRWAIGDLEDAAPETILDEPSSPSSENMNRIRYLFDEGIFDLPDHMRPPCHREGGHSYKSIYGRLSWDLPAQTITRGFYSTCMGRFVHPSRPRTLTAHEAARIQFFPDFFDFRSAPNRTALALLIGNAVPPKLGFVATMELFGGGAR